MLIYDIRSIVLQQVLEQVYGLYIFMSIRVLSHQLKTFISIEMCLKEQLHICSKLSNGDHQAWLCPSPAMGKSIHIIQMRSSYLPLEVTISSLGTINWSRLLSNKWLLVMFADAQGPLTSTSWDKARSPKLMSLWSSAHNGQMPLNWLTKAIWTRDCSIVPSLHLPLSPCHVLLLRPLLKTWRHIHEGSIINQSGFGWLPDGWVIIAIIDTGWYEPCYLGLMLLEFRSLTPSYHLVPWWIVLGKVVCTDTHLLPLILCTLLALLRLLPLA